MVLINVGGKRRNSLLSKQRVEVLKKFLTSLTRNDLRRKESRFSIFNKINDLVLDTFKNLLVHSKLRLEPAPLCLTTLTLQFAKLFSDATEPRVEFPMTDRALAERGVPVENGLQCCIANYVYIGQSYKLVIDFSYPCSLR